MDLRVSVVLTNLVSCGLRLELGHPCCGTKIQHKLEFCAGASGVISALCTPTSILTFWARAQRVTKTFAFHRASTPQTTTRRFSTCEISGTWARWKAKGNSVSENICCLEALNSWQNTALHTTFMFLCVAVGLSECMEENVTNQNKLQHTMFPEMSQCIKEMGQILATLTSCCQDCLGIERHQITLREEIQMLHDRLHELGQTKACCGW